MREKTNSVAIFVDVKSAFDSVNHKLMLKTLREQGFDEIFVKLVALLYEHSRVNGHKVGVGVLQDSKLSPILFNQVYDNIRKLIETKWMQRGNDIT